jgi:acrylyl-CoA reductase (NADPH)
VGPAAGSELHTTVYPFILRGAALLGADSTNTPIEQRRALWGRLAGDLRPPHLDVIANTEVTLDELEPVFDAILGGGVNGRVVVRVHP